MIDEVELSGFLASKLAKFKIPEFMQFQTEKLPRIASGKIAKKQLREEAVKSIRKHTRRMKKTMNMWTVMNQSGDTWKSNEKQGKPIRKDSKTYFPL